MGAIPPGTLCNSKFQIRDFDSIAFKFRKFQSLKLFVEQAIEDQREIISDSDFKESADLNESTAQLFPALARQTNINSSVGGQEAV